MAGWECEVQRSAPAVGVASPAVPATLHAHRRSLPCPALPHRQAADVASAVGDSVRSTVDYLKEHIHLPEVHVERAGERCMGWRMGRACATVGG